MVNRVNEWPVLLFIGRLAEASANTFVQLTIKLAQNAIASAGKVSGIEICKVISSLDAPDGEAGESNQVNANFTTASKTGFNSLSRSESIWVRQWKTSSAGATDSNTFERVKTDDLTCDGKGRLIWDKQLFAGVQGVGNSNTKLLQFQAWGYLVEGTPLEVLGQMQDDAS